MKVSANKLLIHARKCAFLYVFVIATVGGILLLTQVSAETSKNEQNDSYLTSSKCRSCHEEFYQLWAPSHHGLAMQPYTQAFAKDNLTPQVEEIKVGNARYRAVTDNGAGFVLELLSEKETKYPILHVLGGKNVYYFLTMLDRGHL